MPINNPVLPKTLFVEWQGVSRFEGATVHKVSLGVRVTHPLGQSPTYSVTFECPNAMGTVDLMRVIRNATNFVVGQLDITPGRGIFYLKDGERMRLISYEIDRLGGWYDEPTIIDDGDYPLC